jgi:histidyl-tRNA synthetase
MHAPISPHMTLAEAVVMFAPDEAEKGQVVVKALNKGTQSTHDTADLVDAVKAALLTQS